MANVLSGHVNTTVVLITLPLPSPKAVTGHYVGVLGLKGILTDEGWGGTCATELAKLSALFKKKYNEWKNYTYGT